MSHSLPAEFVDVVLRGDSRPDCLRRLLDRALLATGADLAHALVVDRFGGKSALALGRDNVEVLPERLLPDIVAQVAREGRPIGGVRGGQADEVLRRLNLTAFMCVPLRVDGAGSGALIVAHGTLGNAFVDAARRGLLALREDGEEAPTREPGKAGGSPVENLPADGFVATAPVMLRALARCERFAPNDDHILLSGPSGCGKGELARLIHSKSPRAAKRLHTIAVLGVAATLAESELFGHEKGSFTGADSQHIGLLENAHGCTALLDDIGLATPPMQHRLLRFLDKGELVRVGGTVVLRPDVRVIATSSVPLFGLVRTGKFLKDLYYRLRVQLVRVPPLRSRREDIPLLVRRFMDSRGCTSVLDDAAWKILLDYSWPGEVRELKSLVVALAGRRSARLGAAEVLEDMENDEFDWADEGEGTLAQQHARWERDVLARTWLSAARSWPAAAKRLGLAYTTLRDKVLKGGLVSLSSDLPAAPETSGIPEITSGIPEGLHLKRKSRRPQE